MAAHKLILLGDIAVGKTSLVRRLCLGRFDADYKATVGVDLYRYTVNPETDDAINLVIWDIEGDMAESVLSHHYAAGATGALVVCDAMRPETHERAIMLSDEFRQKFPGRPLAHVLNKVDLDPEAIVRRYGKLESSHDRLFRTSAADGTAVDEAFVEIAHTIVRRRLQ